MIGTQTAVADNPMLTNRFWYGNNPIRIVLDKNLKFDFMLDDGPHTLDSMLKFIKLYSQIMADDGILVIEDVQSWSWI
jgi:hypothetical protein